ncbi:MAG: plastocyanin/azurin family copper-binding protein [Solirubrobacteraceae bacterium]
MKMPSPLLVIVVVSAGGCGAGDDRPDGESPGVTSTLRISAEAGGALRFVERELSATAGTVAITMDNPSAVPHAVAIKGNGRDEQGETVGKDGVSTVAVELEPGTYSFYCPVGSHEAAGMRGTLVVR